MLGTQQLTGATMPHRGNVADSFPTEKFKGAHNRRGPQKQPPGGNLYRTFEDNAPGQQPWVWNPALTGPRKPNRSQSTEMVQTMPKRGRASSSQELYNPASQERLPSRVKKSVPPQRYNLGMGTTTEPTNAIDASRRVPRGGCLSSTADQETSPEAAQRLYEAQMTGDQEHPNLLHTLRTGDVQNYKFRFPPGMDPNGAPTPGVYLPKVMMDTQSLFGSAANKTGSPAKLQYLSKAIPTDWAPRFLTASSVSQSSSVYSNFRKTRCSFDASKDPNRFTSTHNNVFAKPPPSWECAACSAPNPHVKPYGRYKRALEAAMQDEYGNFRSLSSLS